MSENYETDVPSGSTVTSTDTPGTVDAAKQEAADLKDTATEKAKDVVGTAKEEASVVIGEAKSQAKDLFAQTKSELKEQANTQQQRIAFGLRSVSDELDSMASNSDSGGLATDLVRQVSGRASSAASWLGDRDPSAVLTEVKRYARRKPGTFIILAAVAGVVVGRLTRALASNASDEAKVGATPTVGAPQIANGAPSAAQAGYAWAAPVAFGEEPDVEIADTPIYAQSVPSWNDESTSEGRDDRSDTV